MMKTSGAKHARGFSLLEVMISGAIMLSVLTGVVSACATVMKSFNHQTHLTQVIYVAEAQMELLLSLPGDSEMLETNVVEGPTHFDKDGNPQGNASVYAVTWRAVPHPVVAKVRTLTVTVTWDEDGETKTFDLKTERL